MEIKITSLDINAFISFISKLTSVDKTVYLKINGDSLISSVYLPDRDAVKLQQINYEEIMSFKKKPESEIKISFFNGSRITDALKNFGPVDSSEVTGVIECAEYDNEIIATSLKISTPDLSIKLACSDPVLGFMDLTGEQIKSIFSKNELQYEFDFQTFNQGKVNSLFSMDKDSETFLLVYESGSVRIKSADDLYNVKISENAENIKTEYSESLLYKKYLGLLDKESYTVSVCTNKLIFKSNDSNTLLTISVCSNE
jgi:hypothetical protein